MSGRGARLMAPPAAVGPFRPGDLVPGTPYRVEGLVGSGGMGRVYRVEHRELGRKFVLKALHGHLVARKDLQARLRNEWRALGKLEHPNIVQVTDAGQTADGLPFYVMENLRGVTLGQLLVERKKLGPREACAIAADVLSGLHAAHETGAIHRDIKPPNIFVSEGGQTKLLDFGIAKLRDQSAKVVTAGGVSIGTPRYMAPEQASGTDVDGRADIYATALVLFEMVVGRGPFAHIRDPNDLVMAHIGEDPERADFVDPTVPEELGDLIQRWLSKSPDSRPVSADYARREILALLESLPADLEGAGDEPTLGGDYDASTVGAPGRLDELPGPASTRISATPEGAPEAAGLEDEEATTTVSLDDSPVPQKPEEASDVGGAVGPAGTLGWGTSRERVSPQTRGAEGAVASATHRPKSRRRPSMTPPPVSSLRGVPSGGRTTVKWIAATAAVSFVVALGVSQWLAPSDEQGEEAAEGAAAATVPMPSDEGQQGPPATPGGERSLQREDLPEVLAVDSGDGEVSLSGPKEEKESEEEGVDGVAPPENPSSPRPESASGAVSSKIAIPRKPKPDSGSKPAARTAPARIPGDEALPESGLW